jgi:membrane-associated phospholipid phosphatase
MNNVPRVINRLRSELGLKLILILILYPCVYLPYLFLQRRHFFPATTLKFTSLDGLIPFSDRAVWLYLSVYWLMPAGPFLMTGRKQLWRYAAGILLISLLADLVFLFWPTICPRPEVGATNVAYHFLIVMDNPFHAFPSLHAAFAIYAGACATLVFREFTRSRFLSIAVWLWVGLILYATLATKQHGLIDIIAGGALGWGIYMAVFNHWISVSKSESLLQPVATGSNATPPKTL